MIMRWTMSCLVICYAGVILGLLAAEEAMGQARNIVPDVPASARPRGPAGELWLLAIGVEQYTSVSPLRFTGDDARSLGKAYREVGQVPDDHIAMVSDEDGQPADRQSLLKAIQDGLARPQDGDTLVFHFSGHGFLADGGTMYLAGSDFDPQSPATTGLAVETLRNELAGCRAKTRFVFLDACHSGAFGAGNRLDGQALANAFRALPGTVTITSSSAQQPSLESAALRQGVFTYWLVRGLRGEANSTVDRQIDAAELFRFVKDKVLETARTEQGLVQQPTWSCEQLADIPAAIPLLRPDRPSVLVPIKRFPLPPAPDTLATLLDTIAHFPQANPRNGIGLAKWVLANSPRGSDLARQAQAHIDRIDEMLLRGEISLDDGRDEE